MRSYLLMFGLLAVVTAFQAGARSAPCHRANLGAVRMQWIPEQHSQGLRWVEDHDLDVSHAAARAKCRAGPSPALEPAEVVDMVLGAFQRGTNEDVEDLFQFVLPNGEMSQEFDTCNAGPMVNFRIKIRKEPRWKNVAGRPHATLLHMRSYDVIGGLMTDPDLRVYMARAQPFFPDAPHAESDVLFQFELVRVRPSSHPSAPGVTAYDGCWMINSIEPKYEDWAVRDPVSVERCPDYFTRPKRSAED